jgi:hypothetical protein
VLSWGNHQSQVGFPSPFPCVHELNISDRQYLKSALSLASKAQDNHLRCLIMALITSHYIHTEETLAMEMLTTCEQLASGLGAREKKGEKAVGNAGMRLWIGQRFLGGRSFLSDGP